jgi:hypothetical protein
MLTAILCQNYRFLPFDFDRLLSANCSLNSGLTLSHWWDQNVNQSQTKLTRTVLTDFLDPQAYCAVQSLHLGDLIWTEISSSKVTVYNTVKPSDLICIWLQKIMLYEWELIWLDTIRYKTKFPFFFPLLHFWEQLICYLLILCLA